LGLCAALLGQVFPYVFANDCVQMLWFQKSLV